MLPNSLIVSFPKRGGAVEPVAYYMDAFLKAFVVLTAKISCVGRASMKANN